jgi:hypothetical protein
MQGDFSRFTFDASRHYLRVLVQQGRVTLDADSNEQTAILLHHIRLLTRFIVGPHGGPADGPLGFRIASSEGGKNLTIGEGPYFVGGFLCVSAGLDYKHQPDLPAPRPLPKKSYLVYLDVWERHLTHLQDGDVLEGSIREVALGGADTATRTQLVSQVKVRPVATERQAIAWIDALPRESTGRMRAHANDRPSNDPAFPMPSGFHGASNRLYRVEVHRSGFAKGVASAACATFKWSRENGSVVFPIVGDATRSGVTALVLGQLGRDLRLDLDVGSWVEIVDDDTVLGTPSARGEQMTHEPHPLLQVKTIDRDAFTVTLDGSFAVPNAMGHPLLRRWEGPLRDIEEGTLLPLEDGVEIEFSKGASRDSSYYRAGDYWLIPARTATRDIEWPRSRTRTGMVETPIDAHGVEHAYAPLAWVDGRGKVKDLRRAYPTLARTRTARSRSNAGRKG